MESRTTRLVPYLLGAALALFAAGIFVPFFHVSKFWIFDEGISVVHGILTLLEEGEYFLFVIITLFTLVFPCTKLGLLALLWYERGQKLERSRVLHERVSALGKWSMLDVFVVAVLIVAVKASGLGKMEIGLGLYLFTFSVIATQVASAWLSRTLAPSPAIRG